MICIKTVKKFCKEEISNIENYEQAISSDEMWHCHHRRETILTKKDLIEIGEYYNRPAAELIFMTCKDHLALHNRLCPKTLGCKFSDESRENMRRAQNDPDVKRRKSEKLKGNKNGLGFKWSEQSKHQMSQYRKGMRWFNNGVKCVRAKECPEGFVSGRLTKH